MRNCSISITTTVEGQASEITRKGQCELSLLQARFFYLEEQARVEAVLLDGVLRIVRTGDYSQDLFFEKDKLREGRLGIGGADGVIYTKTKKFAYSLTENSLLLSLHYDLILGDEPQEMQLRLFLKIVD